MTETVNFIASAGSTLLLAMSLVHIVYIFYGGAYREHIQKYGLIYIFTASLLAMLGSLTYSLVIGFPACDLCWYQRISLYPIVCISGLALYKKSTESLSYMLAVLLPGFAVSLYHNYIYYTGNSPLPCSADGGVSCTVRYVFEFGFMTIPLMALSAFLFIGSTILLMQKKNAE